MPPQFAQLKQTQYICRNEVKRDMKANELMVGDWVRHINGTPYQVTCIKDGHFACSIPHLWEYNNKFEPIPLTAEILEKNGFTQSNIFIEWKHEEEGIYILWKPFPFLKIETENVQLNLSGCEYAHELQHALRLCGIDKTIEL